MVFLTVTVIVARTGCRESYLDLRGKEETGDWRKLHNKELHISYLFTNIVGVIKIKGHDTGRVCVLVGNHENEGQFEDPVIDG